MKTVYVPVQNEICIRMSGKINVSFNNTIMNVYGKTNNVFFHNYTIFHEFIPLISNSVS